MGKSNDIWIGKSFTTNKGNTLTITAIAGKRNRNKVFNFHCNVCSEDQELWGDEFITCTWGDLNKGQIPCGCSSRPQWSEQQVIILINRRCEELNFVFKGFVEDYSGFVKTYLILYNPTTHNTWDTTTVNSFLKKEVRDPLLNGRGFSDGGWKVKFLLLYNNLKYKNFRRVDKVRQSNKYESYWEVYCTICKNYYSARQNCLIKGKTICDCPTFSGFNKSKPANFYLVRWYDSEKSYLKFGITNREVTVRVSEQKSVSKLNYEIIYTIHHESGKTVLGCENTLKRSLEIGVCPKELLPDGYTETVVDSPENISKILNHVKEAFNLKDNTND